jgi:hypothetical protein
MTMPPLVKPFEDHYHIIRSTHLRPISPISRHAAPKSLQGEDTTMNIANGCDIGLVKSIVFGVPAVVGVGSDML